MAGFFVKKPFTVLVLVVIIVALGFVSFRTMKPELLPNIELPYMIVMTTYPGATSERVEAEVTRPLEQGFSTLAGLKSINSQSRANYSVITMEFTDGANLDTVTIDMMQRISRVEGYWDDLVGTPIFIRMNPNMLPIMIAAVQQEGSSTADLSRFVEETLQNRMEGIDGVASVEISGMRREQVNVMIREEKVEELNAWIAGEIEDEISEKENDLKKTKADLQKKLDDLKKANIDLEEGVTKFADGISEGTVKLGESWVSFGIPLAVQLAEMKKTLGDLEAKLGDVIAKADADTLKAIQAAVDSAMAQSKPMIDQTISNTLAQMEPLILATIMMKINEATLANGGIPPSQAEQDLIEAAVRAEFLTLVTDEVTAEFRINIEAQIAPTIWDAAQSQLQGGIDQLAAGIGTMEGVLDTMVQAQGKLTSMSIETQFELSSAAAQLAAGQMQLTAGISQIETGLEQFEDALETALKAADMRPVLTMSMISQLLTAQNFAMPAGTVTQDNIDYLVRVGDELTSIEELKDMALMDTGIEDVGVIKLSQVADVFMSDNLTDVYARINGSDGVLLLFSKQSERSTTEVTDNITATFQSLSEQYPGLKFTPLMNQGDYIYNVIDSILSDLLWGAFFAILILLLFLRDLRPTFITLCSIPLSLVFALTAMYFSGVTINIISLGGLAVAVGRLVDDSVVVMENIFRLRAKGYSAVKAAVSGTSQVAGAITASTLTTICVFLPLVFVQGLTRQIFKDFGLTFAFALLASLLIALTLVPTVASGLFKNMEPKEHRWLDHLINAYDKALVWSLKYKPVVLIIAVVFLAGSAGLVMTKGFSYMPESSMMNQIMVNLTMPKESSKEQRRETADEAMARIEAIEGVETIGMMSGGGAAGSLTSMFVGGSGNLRSFSSYVLVEEGASGSRIAEEIKAALEDLDTEADVSAGGGWDTSVIGGSGVTINLFGDKTDDLMEASKIVSAELAGMAGIDKINDGMEDTTPELHFTVDRVKAAGYGLTTAQVFQQVNAALTKENNATQVTWQGESYNIIVVNENSSEGTLSPEYIKTLEFTVTKRDGSKEDVKLSEIASVSESQALPSVLRNEQRRYLPVTLSVAEGYNVTLLAQDVETALQNVRLPAGVTFEVTGESSTILDAFEQLGFMLILGLLLVYLVMVAQFQSLKSPFIIMFTIPLAFTGGFLALLITNNILSVISLIGFAMLMGVIVANAIVLVDYINRLRLDGMERVQAIREGAATRMRPILITALATIFALLMMALGVGGGSHMLQPLAIVCIGGLSYGTLMTLFVVPVIYDTINKKELRKIDEADLVVDKEA